MRASIRSHFGSGDEVEYEAATQDPYMDIVLQAPQTPSSDPDITLVAAPPEKKRKQDNIYM